MITTLYVIGWFIFAFFLVHLQETYVITDSFAGLLILISIPITVSLCKKHKKNKEERDKQKVQVQQKIEREKAQKEKEHQQQLNEILSNKQDTWDELEKKYKD